MGDKYPILRPGEIISALSKKDSFIKAKRAAMPSTRTERKLL